MPNKMFILGIDDDKAMRLMLAEWLAHIAEIETIVETAATIKEAEKKISTTFYDVIFLDLNIGKMEGLDTFYFIKSLCSPSSAIVLLTALDVPNWKEIGAQGYIRKQSITKEKVVEQLKSFFKLRSLSSSVRYVENLCNKINTASLR